VFGYQNDETSDPYLVIYTVPHSEVEAEHQRQIEEYLKSLPMSRSGEWRTVTVRQESRASQPRRAGGQPASGFLIHGTGGFLAWADGGMSVSFSIGGSWGPTSVSATVGTASQGNVGVIVPIPAHLAFRGVVLETQPIFRVTELRTEFRNSPSQP
jgi:hypothetical protein